MQRYQIELTGQTALLMHNDNLKFREKVELWMTRPENKKLSVAGDDRTPPFTWIGYCYFDTEHVIIPSDNLMTMFRDAGKKIPTGKKGASFKLACAAGILVDQIGWKIETPKGMVKKSDIMELMDNPDFPEHEKRAEELGFELFSKRATIGKSKHTRVRPRFDQWSCTGTITVIDQTITGTVLSDILNVAGFYVGLCDWRPSSVKSPGPFGKFEHKLKKI